MRRKSSDTKATRSETRTGPRWLLPTNHQNLKYWLATGLILPEAAMPKYYADCLRDLAGWIPLFRDRVAEAALAASTSDKGARAVVLEFDLMSVSGKVQAITSGGDLREHHLHDGPLDDVKCILIPGPLLVASIRKIIFENKDDLARFKEFRQGDERLKNLELSLTATQFESLREKTQNENQLDQAETSGQNLPKLDLSFEPSARGQDSPEDLSPSRSDSLPSHDPTLPPNASQVTDHFTSRDFWPLRGNLPPLEKIPIDAGLRDGAMRALLHHLGNRSALALEVAREAFADSEGFSLANATFRDAMSRALSHEARLATAETRIRLFWGVVDHLWKRNDKHVEVRQSVLDYLDNTAEKEEEPTREGLKKLSEDLRQLIHMTGSTISDLINNHPGPFAHALILFFLRDLTDDLIEFDTPGAPLTDADRLAAAILFSLREGWTRTPVALRDIPGMYQGIAQRMAKALHTAIGSSLDFGPIIRLSTLREAFQGEPWTKDQQTAALELARLMKWTDAIETRIQLGKGSYRLQVGGPGSMQIILPGEVKAVSIGVIAENLLDHIAQCRWPIDPSIETRVRGLLQGKQG